MAFGDFREACIGHEIKEIRTGEILALDKTQDLDFVHKTINIRVTLTLDVEGKYIIGTKIKTYNSKREISMTPMLESVLKML